MVLQKKFKLFKTKTSLLMLHYAGALTHTQAHTHTGTHTHVQKHLCMVHMYTQTHTFNRFWQ